MSVRVTKLAKLHAAMAANDWRRALSIAAKFPELGAHEHAIRKGHEAMQRPGFQKQLGRDPDEQVAAGIAALKARYGDGD
jgi:hypothetical protein